MQVMSGCEDDGSQLCEPHEPLYTSLHVRNTGSGQLDGIAVLEKSLSMLQLHCN
jgi:hypothetical protein